jgi:HD domain/Immunity protein Imm1
VETRAAGQPVIRWWADALVPLPPSQIGADQSLYWLSEPPASLGRADLPRPMWTARLLGCAVDDLIAGSPAVAIGRHALLAAAPITASGINRVLAATCARAEAAGPPVPAGFSVPSARDSFGASSFPEPATDAAFSSPAPAPASTSAEYDRGNATTADDRLLAHVSTAGSGAVLVRWPAQLSGATVTSGTLPKLLDDISGSRPAAAGGSETPFLVSISPASSGSDTTSLSIGVGGAQSIALWRDPAGEQVSRGDLADDGTAIAFSDAAGPVIYPSACAISAEQALEAAEAFARDHQQPAIISWVLARLPLSQLTASYGQDGLKSRLLLEARSARFTGADMDQLQQAFDLATRLHGGRRRQTESYLNHDLRTAIRIMSEYRVHDADVICAALLHDVLEAKHAQVEVTASELEAEFGPRVADLIQAVTRPPGDLSPDAYREHLAASLGANPVARIIKASEFTDNAAGLKHATGPDVPRLAARYASALPVMRELIRRDDTPLDDAVKTQIQDRLARIERCLDGILLTTVTS